MTLLSILRFALSFVNWLAQIAHDKQLLQSGEYKAIARSNEEALNAIRAAEGARSRVSNDPDSVRDDPGNRDER